MFEFDLQRFDETENVTAEETSTVETTAEDSPELSELPEGFEGLEEFKDDILKDIAESQKAQSEDSGSGEVANQKIPYERFKQKVDEVNALKAQIDELKKQNANVPPPVQNQSQQTPQQRQPPIPQPQVQQLPQIQLTPEAMGTFKQVVRNEAMRIAKLTPEQVKEIEDFAEEGDENAERWNYANQIATNNVIAAVRQAQQNQAAKAQMFMAQHNAAVQSYNDFTAQAMQAPDYQEVVAYATGELFDSLPPIQQQAIANSYVRIEKQIASPMEIMLIQSYYNQARAALQAKKSQRPVAKNAPKSANLPKVDQINGASGNSGGELSTHDLEKIINNTTDFDKLDPKIKALFER